MDGVEAGEPFDGAAVAEAEPGVVEVSDREGSRTGCGRVGARLHVVGVQSCGA